jgi:hypothetical protein
MYRLAMMMVALSLGCGCAHSVHAGPSQDPASSVESAAESAPSKLAAPVTALASALVGCNSRIPTRLPRHVFVIMLENEDYDNTFGDSVPPSPLKELAKQGELLSEYYGIGHNSLDNYIALISGQAPNPATQGDCPYFAKFLDMEHATEIKNHVALKMKDHFASLLHHQSDDNEAPDYGQAIGVGCVYPERVMTIANQLQSRSTPLQWRAYMEDMPERCRHPEIGKEDDTRAGPYAVRHNPFAYFDSLLKDGSCKRYDRPLGAIDPAKPGLAHDLAKEAPPAFVFISPNLCNDGHNECGQGKLNQVSAFLRSWVPVIQRSAAYKDDGMIIITFDEAEVSSQVSRAALEKNKAASKSCCDEPPGPFAEHPGIFGPGGGKVGALILSPLVEAGKTNKHEFNHYSLLKSVEDMFQLDHLGFAQPTDLKTFQECDVFKADES